MGERKRGDHRNILPLLGLLPLLVLVESRPAGGVGDVDGGHLPKEVRQVLDVDYRGWTAPKISNDDLDICWRNHSPYEPTVVWADFDGDSTTDYAVELEVNRKVLLVMFLAREGAFAKQVVDPDLREAGILAVAKKGSKYFDHEQERGGTYRLNTISIVYCEKSAVSYIRGTKGFQRVFVED